MPGTQDLPAGPGIPPGAGEGAAAAWATSTELGATPSRSARTGERGTGEASTSIPVANVNGK